MYLSPTQKKILQDTSTRNIVWSCGYGGGKTTGFIIKVLDFCKKYPGYHVLIGFPSYNLISTFVPMLQSWMDHFQISYTHNKNENLITTESNNQIYLRSSDIQSRSKVVQFEVALMVLDEADCKPSDFREIYRLFDARNRQKLPDGAVNQNLIIGTPDKGIAGGMYDFIQTLESRIKVAHEKGDDDVPRNLVKLYQSSTLENKHHNSDHVAAKKLTYSEAELSAFVEGAFVSLSDSLVYHQYDPTLHTSEVGIDNKDTLYFGIDFGTGGNSFAVVIKLEHPLIHVVDEVRAYDTQELCEKLASKYQHHHRVAFGDRSGTARHSAGRDTDFDILQDFGFETPYYKKPRIYDRINQVNKAFSMNHLRLNQKKTDTLHRCLISQQYDEAMNPDRRGRRDAYSHPLDSMGYAIYNLYENETYRPRDPNLPVAQIVSVGSPSDWIYSHHRNTRQLRDGQYIDPVDGQIKWRPLDKEPEIYDGQPLTLAGLCQQRGYRDSF